ncbi:MAG: YaeQ family protein, partial [Candidatus Obscuribacterales bacterium]|nr:YaeQ family protein [Steroidobacteraceae bacterium]
QGERIHRAASIEIYAIDRELIGALTTHLERRMDFDLSVSERHLYVTYREKTLAGVVDLHKISPG